MIQENLQNLSFSEGPHAKSIEKEIQGLTIEKLHKIKDPKRIKEICDKVIQSIEKGLLVHIDEDLLKKRVLKNEKNKSLKFTDDDMYRNGANIRNDWANKEGGTPILPYGYIYHDGKGILGVIYESASNNGYRAFIKNGIANNAHGASLLIGIMKKRVEKLMQKV